MQIQYVANGSRRTVRDSVGQTLVGRGIAREVVDGEAAAPAPKVKKPRAKKSPSGISPRTGKPTREYKRRDMRPES